MAMIKVDEHDLKAVLSLLDVYMGNAEPSGHFKDPDRLLVDAFYFVRVANLKAALKEQQTEASQ
jgi:hypothetical protein